MKRRFVLHTSGLALITLLIRFAGGLFLVLQLWAETFSTVPIPAGTDTANPRPTP
ncbi:MAG: hypothetical protein R6U51_09530 [Anaerolineales bacterium]